MFAAHSVVGAGGGSCGCCEDTSIMVVVPQQQNVKTNHKTNEKAIPQKQTIISIKKNEKKKELDKQQT